MAQSQSSAGGVDQSDAHLKLVETPMLAAEVTAEMAILHQLIEAKERLTKSLAIASLIDRKYYGREPLECDASPIRREVP